MEGSWRIRGSSGQKSLLQYRLSRTPALSHQDLWSITPLSCLFFFYGEQKSSENTPQNSPDFVSLSHHFLQTCCRKMILTPNIGQDGTGTGNRNSRNRFSGTEARIAIFKNMRGGHPNLHETNPCARFNPSVDFWSLSNRYFMKPDSLHFNQPVYTYA